MNIKTPFFLASCLAGGLLIILMLSLIGISLAGKSNTLVIALFQLLLLVVNIILTYCISRFIYDESSNAKPNQEPRYAIRRVLSLRVSTYMFLQVIGAEDSPEVKIRLAESVLSEHLRTIDDMIEDWIDISPGLKSYLEKEYNVHSVESTI